MADPNSPSNSPVQIPFDLAPPKAMSFDSFLTSECNHKTLVHIKDWQNWSSPILLLIGESGTGKTHLGQAFTAQGDKTIVIDDIENSDESELFSIMNLALTGEIDALLLTAKAHPDNFTIVMPDLRSRLKNTPVLELHEPDDELLEGIMRRLFEDRGRVVSKDVVTYIVSRTARTVPALQRLVEYLERQAQSDKSDMTKAFVSRHISQWDEAEIF